MLLGEAGPLPMILLIAALITLAKASTRSLKSQLIYFSLFVLIIDMMATHGTLGTRYHNLMLAVLLGLTADRVKLPAGGIKPVQLLNSTGLKTISK